MQGEHLSQSTLPDNAAMAMQRILRIYKIDSIVGANNANSVWIITFLLFCPEHARSAVADLIPGVINYAVLVHYEIYTFVSRNECISIISFCSCLTLIMQL